MIDAFKKLPVGYVDRNVLEKGLNTSLTSDICGEQILLRAADACSEADVHDVVLGLLTDLRSGRLRLVALEPPPCADSMAAMWTNKSSCLYQAALHCRAGRLDP